MQIKQPGIRRFQFLASENAACISISARGKNTVMSAANATAALARDANATESFN